MGAKSSSERAREMKKDGETKKKDGDATMRRVALAHGGRVFARVNLPADATLRQVFDQARTYGFDGKLTGVAVNLDIVGLAAGRAANSVSTVAVADAACLRRLLKVGVDEAGRIPVLHIVCEAPQYGSALNDAIAKGHHRKACRLLDHGADPRRVFPANCTNALHHALEAADIRLTERLLLNHDMERGLARDVWRWAETWTRLIVELLARRALERPQAYAAILAAPEALSYGVGIMVRAKLRAAALDTGRRCPALGVGATVLPRRPLPVRLSIVWLHRCDVMAPGRRAARVVLSCYSRHARGTKVHRVATRLLGFP